MVRSRHSVVFDEIQIARDARIPHTEFHGQSSDSENGAEDATRLSAKRAHVSAAWRQVVTEKRDARGKAAATLALVETAFIDAAAARGFVKELARRRKVDGDVAIFVDLALITAHATAIADIVPRAVVPCAHRRYDALNGCRHGACAFPSSLIAFIH
jgi:hypothetical protein